VSSRGRVRAALVAALATVLSPLAAAHEGGQHPLPPPRPTRYEPPAPGSYELPPIQVVSERSLLASDGERARLLGLVEGQVAVVSFIYRSCSDASGCPLALAVMRRLDREIARRPDLAPRARLVTVSFDPARDTPAKMAELAEAMSPVGDWTFLTPAGEDELEPLLADFGQNVVRRVLSGGDDAVLGHVLKVFLIDSDRRVRNIYSTGFLRSELVVNDILTVLGEEKPGG
jgi:cytochrome c peroxidase